MEQRTIFELLKNLESLILRGSRDVFTTPDAALYLGVSKQYLYKLTSANRIIFYRPEGKQIYFKREDLNDYLLRNRNNSSAELQEQAIAYVNTPKHKGGKK